MFSRKNNPCMSVPLKFAPQALGIVYGTVARLCAALSRAGWHAEQGDWGAWSRALSEADYWETKELEHIPPSM